MITSKVIEGIKERGFITDKEIKLLKRRANAGEKFIINVRLTFRQFYLHISMLKNRHRVIKLRGDGCFDKEILKTAKYSDLIGFMDISSEEDEETKFMPIYRLSNGFKYSVHQTEFYF